MTAGAAVRPARSGEADVVTDVVRRAFGADEGPTVADLLADLEADGALRASLVAERDGVVVGHVALSRGWVDARDRLVEALVLSPLSVLPAEQGRGTGAALVAAALAEARSLGAPAVFLEGDPAFYRCRGFVPAADLGFRRPSDRVPGDAFQVVLLDAGTPRGRLVYAEAFWRRDAVGLRDPLLARLEGACAPVANPRRTRV